jgi:hypothetical protein
MAVVGVFAGVTVAFACPTGRAVTVRANVPGLSARTLTPAATKDQNNSIVGMWQTTYTSGGVLFDMSFEQWHSDGTEFENAMDSPLISAVCQGVWQYITPRTVKLHHLGWSYDASGTTLLGTFSFDQVNTLANDGNSYTGTFVFQPYDLDGNPVGDPITGNVSSVRVTVR